MSKLKPNSIFVAGGQPTVTYVKRSSLQLEEKLQDYLDTAYKLLSITGPTKSGKTVLCNSVIDSDEAVWISGGEVADEGEFWTHILDSIGGFSEETESEAATQSTSDEVQAGAEVGFFGAKVGGKGTTGHGNEKSSAKTKRRASTTKKRAIDTLVAENVILIIDDFHYLNRDTQTSIIRALKRPIFQGLRVIVLAVPHRAYDAVRVETEMTGRVEHLRISPWTQDDLAQIAETGFPELKIVPPNEVTEVFPQESFGSPHLMQDFCLRLCLENGIREAPETQIEISGPDDEKRFFGKIAENASKVAFDRLARGPRQRSDRQIRRFLDGQSGDIYLATLHALAKTGPKINLTYEEIRSAIKQVLADEIPQAHEISRVLVKMTDIAREQIEGEPVLEWDEETRNLHIVDPFFAFYLRWGALQAQ